MRSSAILFGDTQKFPSDKFFSGLGFALLASLGTMPAKPRHGLLKELPRPHRFAERSIKPSSLKWVFTM